MNDVERKRTGEYLITVRKNGITIDEIQIKNRLMDVLLDTEIGILTGNIPDLEIKYFSVGTGNSPVTNSDLKLVNETHRYPPTTLPILSANGEVTTEWILTENDAPVHIKEIGIYCGSSATNALDTGKLISRILWDFDKTSNVELNIKRIDKVVR